MRRDVSTVIVSMLVAAAVLSGASTGPLARADDPLGPIRGAVNGDRSRTACPAFKYSQVLEDAAQARARLQVAAGVQPTAYHGKTTDFTGFGDPQAAAINMAYKKGAGDVINDCSYTEFGVGFVRQPEDELGFVTDWVTIFFGTPAASTPTTSTPSAGSGPTLVPTPAAQPCPSGSPTPTVPAFGTCAPVAAPKGKVSVSFVKGPLWTINVANAANIAGTCSYTANGPGGGLGNRSFDIGANGSASFQVPAPLPLVSYHVVTSCHGTFNGQDVEFGHDEQDVSG